MKTVVSLAIGLAWLGIDYVVMTTLFGALERRFGRQPRSARGVVRTDLVYFIVGHLFVRTIADVAMAPGEALCAWAAVPSLRRAVASQPLVVQIVEVIVVADAVQYTCHRLAHRVPFLWRIHAVHHSCERMDWLAGSRLHLVDIVVMRAMLFTPLSFLGFAREALGAYLVVVSFHAVFIHADVGLRLGWLERFVVTPRYHHWHHGADVEAVDTNFALHLPILDRLFGTQRLPPGDVWPARYGVAGEPVPHGYLAQLTYPFRGAREAAPAPGAPR